MDMDDVQFNFIGKSFSFPQKRSKAVGTPSLLKRMSASQHEGQSAQDSDKHQTNTFHRSKSPKVTRAQHFSTHALQDRIEQPGQSRSTLSDRISTPEPAPAPLVKRIFSVDHAVPPAGFTSTTLSDRISPQSVPVSPRREQPQPPAVSLPITSKPRSSVNIPVTPPESISPILPVLNDTTAQLTSPQQPSSPMQVDVVHPIVVAPSSSTASLATSDPPMPSPRLNMDSSPDPGVKDNMCTVKSTTPPDLSPSSPEHLEVSFDSDSDTDTPFPPLTKPDVAFSTPSKLDTLTSGTLAFHMSPIWAESAAQAREWGEVANARAFAQIPSPEPSRAEGKKRVREEADIPEPMQKRVKPSNSTDTQVSTVDVDKSNYVPPGDVQLSDSDKIFVQPSPNHSVQQHIHTEEAHAQSQHPDVNRRSLSVDASETSPGVDEQEEELHTIQQRERERAEREAAIRKKNLEQELAFLRREKEERKKEEEEATRMLREKQLNDEAEKALRERERRLREEVQKRRKEKENAAQEQMLQVSVPTTSHVPVVMAQSIVAVSSPTPQKLSLSPRDLQHPLPPKPPFPGDGVALGLEQEAMKRTVPPDQILHMSAELPKSKEAMPEILDSVPSNVSLQVRKTNEVQANHMVAPPMSLSSGAAASSQYKYGMPLAQPSISLATPVSFSRLEPSLPMTKVIKQEAIEQETASAQASNAFVPIIGREATLISTPPAVSIKPALNRTIDMPPFPLTVGGIERQTKIKICSSPPPSILPTTSVLTSTLDTGLKPEFKRESSFSDMILSSHSPEVAEPILPLKPPRSPSAASAMHHTLKKRRGTSLETSELELTYPDATSEVSGQIRHLDLELDEEDPRPGARRRRARTHSRTPTPELAAPENVEIAEPAVDMAMTPPRVEYSPSWSRSRSRSRSRSPVQRERDRTRSPMRGVRGHGDVRYAGPSRRPTGRCGPGPSLGHPRSSPRRARSRSPNPRGFDHWSPTPPRTAAAEPYLSGYSFVPPADRGVSRRTTIHRPLQPPSPASRYDVRQRLLSPPLRSRAIPQSIRPRTPPIQFSRVPPPPMRPRSPPRVRPRTPPRESNYMFEYGRNYNSREPIHRNKDEEASRMPRHDWPGLTSQANDLPYQQPRGTTAYDIPPSGDFELPPVRAPTSHHSPQRAPFARDGARPLSNHFTPPEGDEQRPSPRYQSHQDRQVFSSPSTQIPLESNKRSPPRVRPEPPVDIRSNGASAHSLANRLSQGQNQHPVTSPVLSDRSEPAGWGRGQPRGGRGHGASRDIQVGRTKLAARLSDAPMTEMVDKSS
ncbi:hypothetical protein K439DRAFT_1640516 [Ramaria rubella]|nr:hypothetical protein K439DRAFT_1640516 [Ramaria rubella]